jgi:hypothetical protein
MKKLANLGILGLRNFRIRNPSILLYTTSLITTEHVIPAEAGIQENTGFRVKPGMTNNLIFMSLCAVQMGIS